MNVPFWKGLRGHFLGLKMMGFIRLLTFSCDDCTEPSQSLVDIELNTEDDPDS